MAQPNADQVKEVIENGIAQAQELLQDPSKINELLAQLQEQIKNLPDTFQSAAANVPLMATMVKSYITQEYTEVSPKVVASLVAAFLYLINQKDLINDKVPLLGVADDLAVATFAMKLCEPELKAFEEWQKTNQLPEQQA